MGKEKWQRRSSALLFAALILFGIYILLKYALVMLLPFLAALAVSLPLFALAKRSSRSLGGRVKAWCRFYVAVFWLIVAVIMTLAVRKLYGEAQELARYLGENVDMIKDVVGSSTDNALRTPTDSPILEELGEIGEKIAEGISAAGNAFSAAARIAAAAVAFNFFIAAP